MAGSGGNLARSIRPGLAQSVRLAPLTLADTRKMAKNRLKREDLEKLREITAYRKMLEFANFASEFYVDFWKHQKLLELGIDTSSQHEISLENGNIVVHEQRGDKAVPGDGGGEGDEGVSGSETQKPKEHRKGS